MCLPPVAFISSASVAPSGRFSRASTCAALLPSRVPFSLAALGAFFGGLAFLAAFPFLGATCAPCAPTRAFFVAFGFSAVAVSSVAVFTSSPWAVITAIT